MLKPLFSSRQNTLTTIVFLIAFVLCGAAWMRFFSVIVVNPSPVRYADLVGEQGRIAPFRQDCAGPAFITGDTVWRFCEYAESSFTDAAPWGLVRFDLAAGEGSLRWPLPENAQAQLLALAQAPSGDLVTAWGAPDLHALYVIRAAGGVEVLSLPAERPPTVLGLAWTGTDTLELVAEASGGAAIYTYAGGAWSDPRVITPPEFCAAADTLCTPQAAQHTATGWRTYVAAAPRTADTADSSVTILAADSEGAAEPVATIMFADLDPAHLVRDDAGTLQSIGPLLDRAPGGAVNWTIRAAPLMLQGATWAPIAAPQEGASFYFGDYAIVPDGLRWIPATRYPQRGWHLTEWVTLRASGDDIALAALDGPAGPTLTHSATLAQYSGADTTLLPASDGGYWVLGPYGAYLKATASLKRADALSLPERFAHVARNFGERGAVVESFYREQRALKLAAFPLVLLSLPSGYALVFYVRQTRRNRRAWVRLLLQVSAVYLIVATLFIWWFWELMDAF